MIRAGVFGLSIVLETDDPSVKSLLEFVYVDKRYNFFLKKVTETKVRGKIYDKTKKNPKTGNQFYKVGIGFAAYILNIFQRYLLLEDVADIKKAVIQDSYRAYPFPELRDYQNDDVLHILKYKIGLVTVQTGYGKSQVIAVLSKYFYQDMGKKVLLVTPSIKARDELIKRIYSLYGIEVSTKFGHGGLQALITQGFKNKKDLKDPNKELEIKKELASFDVVLCDEVEYCINPGGCYIFDNCIGATSRYGFSGTADKSDGNMINFQNGLSDPTIAGNIELIKYFGPSLVYRKPLDREVDLINIKTDSLNKVVINCDNSTNIYLDVMTQIFTTPEVCEIIVKIAKTFPRLFIPINNLVNIINYWISNYWIGTFRILLVCAKGYVYYDLNGNIINLTLSEACNYINQGLVDIIPSTSSGFRALDFPNLKNILVFSGNIAGSVLQQIGRVARQKHMNIITLEPKGKKVIPVYSKGCKTREKMIKEYYKYCKLTKVFIDDDGISSYPGEV